MLFLISYDLKAPGRDYNSLYDLIKTAPGLYHCLESTWIISTSLDIKTWSDKIRAVIDSNDRFLIVDITNSVKNYAINGWLDQKAWDWLNSRR